MTSSNIIAINTIMVFKTFSGFFKLIYKKNNKHIFDSLFFTMRAQFIVKNLHYLIAILKLFCKTSSNVLNQDSKTIHDDYNIKKKINLNCFVFRDILNQYTLPSFLIERYNFLSIMYIFFVYLRLRLNGI